MNTVTVVNMRHPETLKKIINEYLAEKVISMMVFKDELTIEVSPKDLLYVINLLKTNAEFDFSQLIDICGVDYAAYGIAEWDVEGSSTGFSRGVDETSVGRSDASLNAVKARANEARRFAVVYHLLSITHNSRITIKIYLSNDTDLIVDSVVDLYACADWYEREVFDLFGILFKGHPDLRRILTDYGFVGHPLRKDFPLVGHVEVVYDAALKRVVYQPVEIESRVNIPRTIRTTNSGTNAS